MNSPQSIAATVIDICERVERRELNAVAAAMALIAIGIDKEDAFNAIEQLWPEPHEIDGRPALFFVIRSDHPRGPAGLRVAIDSPEAIDASIEALRAKAQAIAKDLRDGTGMADEVQP